MKQCTGKNGCNQVKELDAFSNDKSTNDGLARICKECDTVKRRKYKHDTRPKVHRKLKFTEDEYAAMYLAQNGRCLICDKEFNRLVLDHNHDNACVRGLLCSNCNAGIGLLGDNPMNLKRAMDYLLEKGFYG